MHGCLPPDLTLSYRHSAVTPSQVVVAVELALEPRRPGPLGGGHRRDRALAARAPAGWRQRRVGVHQPGGRLGRSVDRRGRVQGPASGHGRGVDQARQLHPGGRRRPGRRRLRAHAGGAAPGGARHRGATGGGDAHGGLPPRRWWTSSSLEHRSRVRELPHPGTPPRGHAGGGRPAHPGPPRRGDPATAPPAPDVADRCRRRGGGDRPGLVRDPQRPDGRGPHPGDAPPPT